jgi:asparagine synthase (glutamine-hydrolysing)
VKLRMEADVPLGAFLSGGIDSSTVVALMQAQNPRPVKTFTIGYTDPEFNEADNARAVASHLGTDHTQLDVTAEEALGIIPELSSVYDEPFADSSQIPTALVARLARRDVKVSLSGDGGDELFGGYNRHVFGKRVVEASARLPMVVRKAGARALRLVSQSSWDALLARLQEFTPKPGPRLFGDKIHKLAEVLPLSDHQAVYSALVSHWKDPSSVVLGAQTTDSVAPDRNGLIGKDITLHMMFLDLVGYLPNDILAKVDRATMAVGLEGRLPLLDHRVVEFSWTLPLSTKVRDGQGKWILRRVLDRYVPRHLVERPKMGFGVPLGEWLRGPLRVWAQDLIDPSRLRREGFLNPEPIARKWAEHVSRTRDWEYDIWDVLMFQSWLEHKGDAASSNVA